MENFRINAKDEVEKKEIINLLESIGCKLFSEGYREDGLRLWIVVFDDGDICLDDGDYVNYKQITIRELRDLVVLKRNDRADANVGEGDCLYDLYLTKSNDLYLYHCGKNKWILSNISGDKDYCKLLKPIEPKMSILDTGRHTQPEELPELKLDNVNHPAHYTGHPSGIECIEITRHHDFAIGNAIKYLWRAGLKDSDNEVQDLEKAAWYIQDKISQLSK